MKMKKSRQVIPLLGQYLQEILMKVSSEKLHKIQEIRLRTGKPLMMHLEGRDYFLRKDGQLTKHLSKEHVSVTTGDIKSTLEQLSQYSLYAYEEELKNGYMTVEGGHRIGVVGKVVLEGNKIKTIRHVSGLNIRIAHEIKGCANHIVPLILKGESIYHTLIVSPPKCGKTTLLRDIVRQLANERDEGGQGLNLGVVDERSEIGGCFKGVPQNDVGLRTDVLDSCPKAEGMIMLLRAMAPDVIAVDEIGSDDDLYAISHILQGGIKLICTVHGSSMEELLKKPMLKKLLEEEIFERIIFLTNKEYVGQVEAVMDQKGINLIKGS